MEPCVFYAPLDRYVGQHIDWHIGRLIIWYVGQYVDRYIGQYIGWDVSVDTSTNVSIRYWSSYGWHIDRLSADSSVNIADDIRPICWLLIIGGISVACQWSISRLSYGISQKFRVGWSNSTLSQGFMFGSSAQIQMLSSKTLKWNTAKCRKYKKKGGKKER